MKMIFSTLFDSFYLDKGVVMYESLCETTSDFMLYIFSFDDVSYDILKKMNLKNVVVVHKNELERTYPILKKLQSERSKAEYCWTCTPLTVEYVLDEFSEKSCTYIDADLFFFNSPLVLFKEIEESKANIVITPHRFSKNYRDARLCKRSGKYCVEFNYFDNSTNSREALTWWKEKCFEWCFHLYEPERMGDQKYLEKFPVLFKGVHELENLGGGVAPWNLRQYKLSNGCEFITKNTNEKFVLIFYHFQNIKYISKDMVNVCSGTHSKKLKDTIYIPYLKRIERVRKQLNSEYGITFDNKKKYSSNRLIALLQGSILRFKISSLSDLYDLRKIREEKTK